MAEFRGYGSTRLRREHVDGSHLQKIPDVGGECSEDLDQRDHSDYKEQPFSLPRVIYCMRTPTERPDQPQHKVTPEEAFATSGAEAVTTVVRAAVSAIPLVGGPAAELVNALLLPNLAKRRDRFFADLYCDFRMLEERVESFDAKTLVENDQLVSVAVRAAQAALGDHRQEKHEALRNAVLNTAIGIAIEEDVQMLLIDLVDTLTPLHLRLLKFLNDPRSFPQHPDPTPQAVQADDGVFTRVVVPNDGIFTAVEGAFPELRGRRYLCLPLLSDLYNRGLSRIGLSGMDDLVLTGFQLSAPEVEPQNTWLGGQLLQYVATPWPLRSLAKSYPETTEDEAA